MKNLLKLLLIFTFIFNLNGFELKRVILSTNNNPDYIEFWPIVAPLWQKMGLRPTLALIAEDDCVVDTNLGDVIQFKPIPGIAESLQAQVIRLLLPTLFPEDGCIISDIDMIPISPSYFFDGVTHCPENAFLIYRDKAYSPDEPKYPMCYFAAKGSTFSQVFGVNTPGEILKTIQHWNSFQYGWNTDEIMLYHYVNQWEKRETR